MFNVLETLLKISEGFVAEVSEIRTGPILNVFWVFLVVFMDSSVWVW